MCGVVERQVVQLGEIGRQAPISGFERDGRAEFSEGLQDRRDAVRCRLRGPAEEGVCDLVHGQVENEKRDPFVRVGLKEGPRGLDVFLAALMKPLDDDARVANDRGRRHRGHPGLHG
jgi:hypothetical protein